MCSKHGRKQASRSITPIDAADSFLTLALLQKLHTLPAQRAARATKRGWICEGAEDFRATTTSPHVHITTELPSPISDSLHIICSSSLRPHRR